MAFNDKNQGRSVPQGPAIDVSAVKLGEKPSAELYSKIAEDAARDVSRFSGSRFNKSSQIRRFYDELVMWEQRVWTAPKDQREAVFEEMNPYIQMLCAKAAYAKGRELIEVNFYTLFVQLVRQIKDAGTLRQAKLFFEAFLGFTKAFEKK